jgi:hypothetical protein
VPGTPPTVQQSRVVDIGEGLRSSGFSVGAGGGSLIVGGAGGVSAPVQSSGTGGGVIKAGRIGWREL